MSDAVTLRDVYDARPRVSRVVRPTPLMQHALLGAETGLDLYVKHENHNPTGAFKVRGGVNLIAQLPPDDEVNPASAVLSPCNVRGHRRSIAS